MFYYVNQENNQIFGSTDDPEMKLEGFLTIEGQEGEIANLYYDGDTILVKPAQPPGTFWDTLSNGWKPIVQTPNLSIDDIKAIKIQELNAACHNAIISGFESDALGTPHHYDSEETDQMNLIGSVLLGVSVLYVCTNLQTKLKAPVEHTNTQLREVMADGAEMKQNMLVKYHTLVHKVTLSQTPSEIEKIVW